MYTLNQQKQKQKTESLDELEAEAKKMQVQTNIKVKKEEPATSTDKFKDTPSPDPTDIYLKEIGAAPLLSKEEEVYYARLVQKGDKAAKKRMIESNLRLVVKIARRYVRSGMPILDLIEEGNIGLIRAVEKFDPELGFRFSTYGAWWIQQTIERAIMSQNRTIRLPVHVVKRLNACLRTSNALAKELDHEPNAEEIAERMDKKPEEIEHLLALNEKIISIDMPISDEISKPLLDTIGGNEIDPIDAACIENIKDHINRWMNRLSIMQRAVIERRFGLNEYEQTTLEQTGNEIGLTRERVRQLQSEALKLLKEVIESRGEDFDTLVN